MTSADRRVGATARIMDLERTVETLNGQLQTMQWELQQTRSAPLTARFWRNLIGPSQGNEFMSAVCNQRARPNTKLVDHVGFVKH